MRTVIVLSILIMLLLSACTWSQAATVVQVAAGAGHTVAVKSDGTVWTWGWNNYGQLGDGKTLDKLIPGQVPGLSGVVRVAAGQHYTVAVKADGTVWAWGRNDHGQLGDGTMTSTVLPVRVVGLSGVRQVAAGNLHTMALKGDGTVWAWGENYYGQVGDGTGVSRLSPVQVPALSAVAHVAVGYYHSVAVETDGTTWTWGYNSCGQLGDGTSGTNRLSPVQVPGLSGVVETAGGQYHTIALKTDGTVWAWGYNAFGQVGDGTSGTNRLSPVQVTGLSGITRLAAGHSHSFAVKGDGTVCGWGDNENGQLGDGTLYTMRPLPVQVLDVSGVTLLSAGGHAVVLKSDGSVWSWGSNEHGQFGDGTDGARRLLPVQVGALSGIAQAAGSLAVKADGSVWVWGGLSSGDGDGNKLLPAQVEGLFGAMQAVAGGGHIVTAKADGTVWAWGFNWYGQAGCGANIEYVEVATQVVGLSDVVQVGARSNHTVALRSDGTVWAWGDNHSGQLGDGTRTIRYLPTQVSGLSGVAQVAAGSSYTVALKFDGTVWGWGWNGSGQLGDGTATTRLTPVAALGLNSVVQLAAGSNHTVAVKTDGTVWAWGANNYGQLGDGTTTGRRSPVQVPGLWGVLQVACGLDHTVAVKRDGTVWAWGWNKYGQLGDGTSGTDRLCPVQVPQMQNTVQVAAGGGHTTVVKSDRTLWAWGSNTQGQLGCPLVVQALLDTISPTGSVAVNGGAAFSTSRSVTLDLSSADDGGIVSGMRFSNDALTWGSWMPYAASASWTLSEGDGIKTVYARFRDPSGNESDTVSTSIGLGASQSTSAARASADGATAILGGVVVTAVFGDCIYLEEQNRIAGIRVAPAPAGVSVGSVLDVSGTMQTVNGERSVLLAAYKLQPGS